MNGNGRNASMAVAGLCGALAVMTGCDVASPGVHGSTPTARAPVAGVVIPADAVPWAALPFQPYFPAPLPSPTVAPAPPCRLRDLTEQPLVIAGATGNEGLVFDFVNHAATMCLADGYPKVVLWQPHRPSVQPTRGGFWDQRIPAADLGPGAHARFIVGFAHYCLTGTVPPLYQHITVTLPGGGTFAQDLSGITRSPSGILPSGVQAACGVSLTELAVTPPPPMDAPDPLVGLRAHLHLPASIRIGQTLVYVVTLDNPAAAAVALDRCRGYTQLLDNTKGSSSALELNCAAAHAIPGGGSESFVMQLSVPLNSTKAGRHSVCWTLDAGAASGPQACGTVDLTS